MNTCSRRALKILPGCCILISLRGAILLHQLTDRDFLIDMQGERQDGLSENLRPWDLDRL